MPRCLLVFEPPDGGVAEHVRQLALELPRRGWDVTVAGPEQSPAYAELDQAGVEVVRLPIGRALRPLPYARAFARLAGLARSGRYDLLHVHSSKAGAIARPAGRAGGTPVVYTPHCFAFIGPQSHGRVAAALAVERVLAPLTAAVVCVAEAERREALERRVAPTERLRVVRNGCPPCEGGLEPDPELQTLAAEGPLAACLTVLRPQKAVADFVRAAPEILRRAPGARLAVIGDGPLRGPLERLAGELGLGSRMRFLDFSPPAARQLASIDVFVLPSAWEAFPISLLEALACGVPQVATDVGGTAEAVADGRTGLLCPAGDPDALATRVAELLGDRERRREMAAASIQRHAESFGIDRMVDELTAVYDSVLRTVRPATLPA